MRFDIKFASIFLFCSKNSSKSLCVRILSSPKRSKSTFELPVSTRYLRALCSKSTTLFLSSSGFSKMIFAVFSISKSAFASSLAKSVFLLSIFFCVFCSGFCSTLCSIFLEFSELEGFFWTAFAVLAFFIFLSRRFFIITRAIQSSERRVIRLVYLPSTELVFCAPSSLKLLIAFGVMRINIVFLSGFLAGVICKFLSLFSSMPSIWP